jgi:hypothetical protein
MCTTLQALGSDVEYLIRRAQALEQQQAKQDRRNNNGASSSGKDDEKTHKRKLEHGATLEHLAQVGF